MTDTNTAPKPAKKSAIPAQTFETELTPGSAKSAAADAGAKKGELLMVNPDEIGIIEGFNVRIETPDYLEHVASVKRSIMANGFYSNKPLAVTVVKGEGGKSRFMLSDGHTRLRAVKDAIFEGAQIEAIPVVVKPQTQTAEDLIVALVQDNEGRPLSPFERAIVVKRLEGFGWDDKTTAERLGVTERYVSDLKVLAGAPVKVRDLVVRGKVSATEAVKQLRKDPAKAADTLGAAVKDAEAKGKTKATAKNVKAASGDPAEPKTGVTMSSVAKGQKLHTTIVYSFKQGDIVETAEMKPVWMFNDSAWWDYVDEATKEHVVINETIRIEVKIVSAVPADEEGGEGENEDEANAALTDQSGGDGEEGSLDHADGASDENEGL